MVRHHHRYTQAVFLAVRECASIEYDLSRPVWKLAAFVGHKCNEMRLVIPLVVRQISSVKTHARIIAYNVASLTYCGQDFVD